jgi:hypothetical protein
LQILDFGGTLEKVLERFVGVFAPFFMIVFGPREESFVKLPRRKKLWIGSLIVSHAKIVHTGVHPGIAFSALALSASLGGVLLDCNLKVSSASREGRNKPLCPLA